nr:hypothetical protein [Tanacetum cinerariifolium]
NVKVKARWYYRPEDSISGRRLFHGVKELFLSDHYDMQSAHTIEGKCIVHSFKNYNKLDNVGTEDYFCRFEYKAATEAKKLKLFMCTECTSDDDTKRPLDAILVSPSSDSTVEPKRRKR